MEYYSSETCFMEELLLVKDMEYYEDFNYNLDSCLATNNVISSSIEDYSNDFSIDNIQTLNFPISSYELQREFSTQQYSPYANLNAFQLHQSQQDIDQSCILDVPNILGPCKDEPVPIFNCPDNEISKNKMKKVNGQPSKNLMAERRRRKRLNDRLSMLRSVVPKISKMDRTSILGDTIDYMKELLERINNLREEMDIDGGLMTLLFNDAKPPNEILVRNSPKMEVERGNGDTRIKICCAMKPGLLLSTMNTMEEELGLEIQQCVISCFSDFTMQASCSQELKERDAEYIKQALFRNAAAGMSLT